MRDPAVQADGSIVVVGISTTFSSTTLQQINIGFVVRVGPGGTVDAAFADAIARAATLAGVSLN